MIAPAQTENLSSLALLDLDQEISRLKREMNAVQRIDRIAGIDEGGESPRLADPADCLDAAQRVIAPGYDGITVLDAEMVYNGKGNLLRLGIQAYSLGIAYEFDPYFGLSISRVDPLPHQLEAVYDYLLKLARVRFLLADDAGAGKTIMAGLLIKELKLRGMCERILIVAPANLAFQWQRN